MSDKRFIEYQNLWLKSAAVGSRVTCNPSPQNTDEDWLILCLDARWGDLHQKLIADGWALDGSDIPDNSNLITEDERFVSFSNIIDGTRVNFITTRSCEFYKRFVAGTEMAKHLNLLNKQDRIDLFQAVLYGNSRVAKDF